MNISIKKINGEVIFSGDFDSIKDCVLAALREGKNLSYADLSYADLSYADLRSANLSYADLSSANLRYADLRSADLSYANLSYANLSSANLRYAKSDFLAEVLRLPNELEFLRHALINGKVDGSTYSGECACLAGTMAHAKGIQYYSGEEITNGLTFHADASSPRERFFTAISKGDTPKTNGACKIALEWVDEAIQIRDNIRLSTPVGKAPTATP